MSPLFRLPWSRVHQTRACGTDAWVWAVMSRPMPADGRKTGSPTTGGAHRLDCRRMIHSYECQSESFGRVPPAPSLPLQPGQAQPYLLTLFFRRKMPENLCWPASFMVALRQNRTYPSSSQRRLPSFAMSRKPFENRDGVRCSGAFARQ